jgi:hypothetical protein
VNEPDHAFLTDFITRLDTSCYNLSVTTQHILTIGVFMRVWLSFRYACVNHHNRYFATIDYGVLFKDSTADIIIASGIFSFTVGMYGLEMCSNT